MANQPASEVVNTEYDEARGGLRIVVYAGIIAGAIGLSACGGKEMAQLQVDAVAEASGPTKDEQERFDKEKTKLHAVEKQELAQEIADAKAKSKKLYPPTEKDHEGNGGGGGGGGGGSH